MSKVKRKTAIARLRRDCKKKGEALYMSRSIVAENEYGDCYIVYADNGKLIDVIQHGKLEDIMRDRKLLRPSEEVE